MRPRTFTRFLALPASLWMVAVSAAQEAGNAPIDLPDPTILSLHPQAAPAAALRYRLLPIEPELRPGNAAPIYLRIRHELSGDTYKELVETTAKYQDMSIEDLPVSEAREFVDRWGGRLQQIVYGTLREDCDWNYTLPEQRLDSIAILLPDVQEMRNWARLLALKARVEIAEGKFDDAVATIRTGLAFARHVAEAPFLINDLVGIAIASHMLGEAEKLLSRPGAPNLYWALTALPTPMIDLRPSLENEQRLVEWLIPELAPAEEPVGKVQWQAHLEKLHARLIRLIDLYGESLTSEGGVKVQVPRELSAFVEQTLPRAKNDLSERGVAADRIAEMPAGEAITRYLADAYAERRDATYKIAYLPFFQADPLYDAINRDESRPGDLALQIFEALLPVVRQVHVSQERLDRRIAALRIVEAIRLHAAAGGSLPETLDDLKVVPLPTDPITGKPFEYRREGDAALLIGRAPRGNPKEQGLFYRIMLED